MYEITKNGTRLSLEDKARYTKHQKNGVDILCSFEEADGIAILNDYIEPLDGVDVREFNGPARMSAVIAEGAALAQASQEEPAATVGVLAEGFPAWEPGAYYEKRYTLFEHKGDVYFTRQDGITAYAHQEPGATGMESVYGIRPIPDEEGVYPYRRNMAASVGMQVRDRDVVYECIRSIDPVLYPPADLPAHFVVKAP